MMRIRLGISLGLLPSLVFAHSNIHDAMQGDAQVGAAASLSYYSEDSAASDGTWRMAGNLMGGHALPVEKGAGLADAILWGRYKLSPEWQIHAKLAMHDEGDSSRSLSVDNLLLSRTHLLNQPVDLELGLMDATFSPSASSHPSLSRFAERPLMADAFWGGSIHDTGLRLTWKPLEKLSFVTELWSGDFFPATKGDYAQSLLVQTQQQWGQWSLKAGVWGLHSAANERPDDRYSAGHSHSNNTTTFPDVRFTGDTDLAGAWLALDLPKWKQWSPSLHYEYAQSSSEGSLINRDQARQAQYRSAHKAMSLIPSLSVGKHELSYRYERLSLNNELEGAGAGLLATDANLVNTHRPQRQTLQWKWDWHKNIATRVAYTKDQVLTPETERWMVDLIWQQKLYDR